MSLFIFVAAIPILEQVESSLYYFGNCMLTLHHFDAMLISNADYFPPTQSKAQELGSASNYYAKIATLYDENLSGFFCFLLFFLTKII